MEAHFGAPIKQHPGQIQVTRRVKVNVPGKHFPGLSPAEQLLFYEGRSCRVQGAALHYNWKYSFLRPTVKEIIERYNKKFRPTVHTKLVASGAAVAAAAAASAASASAAGSSSDPPAAAQ